MAARCRSSDAALSNMDSPRGWSRGAGGTGASCRVSPPCPDRGPRVDDGPGVGQVAVRVRHGAGRVARCSGRIVGRRRRPEQAPSAISNSSRRIASARSTPAWPPAASAHRIGPADEHAAGAERERDRRCRGRGGRRRRPRPRPRPSTAATTSPRTSTGAGTRSSWRAPWLLTTIAVDAVLDREPRVLGGQDPLEDERERRPAADRREVVPGQAVAWHSGPQPPPAAVGAMARRGSAAAVAEVAERRRARTPTAGPGRGSRAPADRRSGRSRGSPAAAARSTSDRRHARSRLDVELEPAASRPGAAAATSSIERDDVVDRMNGTPAPRLPRGPSRPRRRGARGRGRPSARSRRGGPTASRAASSTDRPRDDVDEDAWPEAAAPPGGLVLGERRSRPRRRRRRSRRRAGVHRRRGRAARSRRGATMPRRGAGTASRVTRRCPGSRGWRASSCARPTASLNATVTSSSLRVSLRGDHDAVAPAGVADAVAVAELALAGDDRAGRPRRRAAEAAAVRRARRRSRSSSQARTGRASDPDGAPSANASRFAARSRDGRNGSPVGRRARAGRSPAGTRRARRRGPASRTGSSAAPRTRGRGRGRARRAAAELRPDHQLGRDLEQEPRRHRCLAHPPGRAAPGVRQVEPPLRPGDADVGEPPLLLELLLVVERPAVREEALLEPGDEDDRELEALGRVERDQRDGVGVALVRVLVGDERGLLEQPVERVVGRQVVVAGRHRAQLEQVRPALLAVLGAVGQHRPVAGRLEGLVEQLGQGQHADPRPQPPDEDREVGQGVPRPRREARRARRARPPRSRPRSCRPRARRRPAAPRWSCRRSRAPGR